MVGRIKESFKAGVAKLRWFAALAGERLKVEIAFFKLMSEAEKLKSKRDAIAKAVGERVFEQKERLSGIDGSMKELLKEMEMLGEELNAIVGQARRLGGEGKDIRQ